MGAIGDRFAAARSDEMGVGHIPAGPSRRGTLVMLGAVIALLAALVATAPALAAQPETPEILTPSGVTGTSATLRGVLNPNAAGEPGGYVFRYRASASECEGPGEKEVPNPSGVSAGEAAESVETTVTDLLPTTTYTYCLFAFNEAFEFTLSAPITFTTPSTKPTIERETAVSVGSTTALVTAQISSGGLSGKFDVEVVSDAQFASGEWLDARHVPVAPADLPAARSGSPARVEVSDLQPETGYHFRFRAVNTLGTTFGEGKSFVTTEGTSALSLPDGRAYELVSGLSISGNAYVTGSGRFDRPAEDTTTEFPFRAAEDGDGLAYVGAPRDVGGSGVTGESLGNQYLALRDPSQGWGAHNITPQVAGPNEEEHGSAYEYFSSDLSLGVFSAGLAPQFAVTTTPAGPAQCQALYSRTIDGGFHALFNVHFAETPGTLACGAVRATAGGFNEQTLTFAGESADGSQLLFQTPAGLVSSTEQLSEGEGNNLYDSVGGRLSVVNTLPDGTHPEAAFGGPSGNSEVPGDRSGVISGDGSRVFWTDLTTQQIYVRENATAPESPIAEEKCTVAEDACTVPVSAGSAKYWTATPDGRYVFYTENGELWRFDTSSATREVLASEGLEGENAGVLGVMGASEDGAYVYFVAEGSLSTRPNSRAETSTRRTCEEAEGEEYLGRLPAGKGCNLYVLHVGQEPSYIAALAAKDNKLSRQHVQKLGGWRPNMGERTSEVTPDGQHLVFESTIQLTGYDNTILDEQQLGGQRGLEVFTYAFDPGKAGELSCASCDPRGIPPQLEAVGLKAGLGTYLPASLNPAFMQRWISDDGGRVFFDSTQSLVAQDTNEGAQDVYEWEREGEGTCDVRPAKRAGGGCVLLISGGNSAAYSYFLDADATGANVFFTHRGQLGETPAPPELNNVYDARVDGGFPAESIGCTGAACPSVPSSPPAVITAPPSVGFEGAANVVPPPSSKPKPHVETRAEKLVKALKACRNKKNKHKRVACEAQARKRFGPPAKKPKAKKQTSKRKAKR